MLCLPSSACKENLGSVDFSVLHYDFYYYFQSSNGSLSYSKVKILLGEPDTDDLDCILIDRPGSSITRQQLAFVLGTSLSTKVSLNLHVLDLDDDFEMISEVINVEPNQNNSFNLMPYIGKIQRIDVLQIKKKVGNKEVIKQERKNSAKASEINDTSIINYTTNRIRHGCVVQNVPDKTYSALLQHKYGGVNYGRIFRFFFSLLCGRSIIWPNNVMEAEDPLKAKYNFYRNAKKNYHLQFEGDVPCLFKKKRRKPRDWEIAQYGATGDIEEQPYMIFPEDQAALYVGKLEKTVKGGITKVKERSLMYPVVVPSLETLIGEHRMANDIVQSHQTSMFKPILHPVICQQPLEALYMDYTLICERGKTKYYALQVSIFYSIYPNITSEVTLFLLCRLSIILLDIVFGLPALTRHRQQLQILLKLQ